VAYLHSDFITHSEIRNPNSEFNSASADQGDYFQAVVLQENGVGVLAAWDQLPVALHSQVALIELQLLKQRFQRGAGRNFARLTIHLDLQGFFLSFLLIANKSCAEGNTI